MNDSSEIRDYLLRSLPPERMEEIEERILTDDAFHEEVEIMEEELVDRYAQGQMLAEERILFERYFLASPLRKQKLAFARALQARTNTVQISPKSFSTKFSAMYPYALAACAIALVALGTVTYRLSGQLQQARIAVQQTNRQIEELRKNTVPDRAAQDLAFQPIVVAQLAPGGSRDSKLARISVPQGIRAVQFALKVPQNLQGEVAIELLDDSGQWITELHSTQPVQVGNNHVVVVLLAGEQLKKGNYFFRITQPPSTKLSYSFQIRP